MNHEEEQYTRLLLEKARNTLSEAELLLNGGFLIGTVNRLYYACFYAVNALLYTEGHSSSKHSGVKSLFDRHWIKTGRLPAEIGRVYRHFFEVRQEGDYQDTAHFDPTDVKEWLGEARLFVGSIADWLRANSGLED